MQISTNGKSVARWRKQWRLAPEFTTLDALDFPDVDFIEIVQVYGSPEFVAPGISICRGGLVAHAFVKPSIHAVFLFDFLKRYSGIQFDLMQHALAN